MRSFESVLSLFLDIGLAVFGMYLLKEFFRIFFEISYRKYRVIFAYLIFGIWQFAISRTNVLRAECNIVITIILVLLVSLTAYQGNKWLRIVFSFSFSVIWMLMETCYGYVFLLFKIDYATHQTAGAIISNISFLLIIISLKRFFQNGKIQELPFTYNIVLMLIPTGSIVVVNTIFSLSRKVSGQERIWLVIVLAIILGMNIIVFMLYLKLTELLQLKRENIIYEQQLEIYDRHQTEREFSMLQLRNLKHNIKNHFITLLAYIKNGECEKAAELIQDILDEDMTMINDSSNTGNIAVDSMMNYFSSLARQRNISFIIKMAIPIQMPYKAADLGLILGNALNNALEAAEKAENKYVHVSMKYDRGNLLIAIKNSFNGAVKRDGCGNLLTIKKDEENHGIGLKTIKRTAEKYCGNVTVEYNYEEFILKVLLYNTQTSQKR